MVVLERSLLYHPDSAGHHIFNLNLALIIASTILVFLHLYVRGFLVKTLGWGDLVTTIAWALSVTISSLEMETTHYGTGAQMANVPPDTLLQFFENLATMELIYFIASGAVRLAILAIVFHLSKNRVYQWFIYGLSVVVVTVSLTGFFFLLTECSQIPDVFNYAAAWRQCRDPSEGRAMALAQSVICIFVDCMLVALSLWAVLSNFKVGAKAIQMLLVFSFGIFAVASGAARFFIILTTNFGENTTYKMLAIATWTDIELHVGLWVCCLPALQPLIRHVSLKMGLRGQLESTGQRSKGDIAIPETSYTKGPVSRWSRSSSYFLNERSETQSKGSPTKGIEMVDLEKGKGRGRILKQRDTMFDVDLSDKTNAGKKSKAGG
ncbi:hypothetical protein LX36DRAFT_621510 [Colletotrichum falcatum]|nr:hypothetical protein LX36DRAFT_621510 [Colletotrichum falcatum]